MSDMFKICLALVQLTPIFTKAVHIQHNTSFLCVNYKKGITLRSKVRVKYVFKICHMARKVNTSFIF